MKNAEKRQSEINEETYKTNVMNQRRTENQRRSQNPMTLLTEINYTRTELIEYNAFQTKMWHSNLEQFRRVLVFDAEKVVFPKGFGLLEGEKEVFS